MKLQLYGTRGSIPTPSDSEMRTDEFGGNTACVYLVANDGSKHIFDAGTGARKLGLRLMREANNSTPRQPVCANLYFSHLHTDHTLALPFFVPAYIPGTRITVYGAVDSNTKAATALYHRSADKGTGILLKAQANGTANGKVKDVLSAQLRGIKGESFPVDLDKLVGLTFEDFTPGKTLFDTQAVRVDTLAVRHPGIEQEGKSTRDTYGCVSYKVTDKGAGKTFVYCTDIEIVPADFMKIISWWQGADLVIADGQYEPQHISGSLSAYKAGWGHTDWETAIQTAAEAKVKKLVLTHHDPMNDDDAMRRIAARATERAKSIAPGLEVVLAREGDVYAI